MRQLSWRSLAGSVIGNDDAGSGLTRKCSRQAGLGQRSPRASPSIGRTAEALICAGAGMNRLQLICLSLDRETESTMTDND